MGTYDIMLVYNNLKFEFNKMKVKSLLKGHEFIMGDFIEEDNKKIGFKIYITDKNNSPKIHDINFIVLIFEEKYIKTQLYNKENCKVECRYLGNFVSDIYDNLGSLISNLLETIKRIYIKKLCNICNKKTFETYSCIIFIKKSIENSEFKGHYSYSIIRDIYDKTVTISRCLDCINPVNKDTFHENYDIEKKTLNEKILSIIKNNLHNHENCLKEILKVIK